MNQLTTGRRKPSELVDEYNAKREALGDAPAAIQSMMQLHYYQEAKKIIAEPSIEKRRTMLTEHPDSYRKEVEKEVRKLWQGRHSS